MKDGPRPMRNMKPSKRNHNAAERFREEHEASYQAHETAEPRYDVDAHNAAYPKMRDELNRRRSTAKATVPAVYANRRRITNEMLSYLCPTCHKMRTESKKPRTRRNVGGRKKQVINSRVAKRSRRYASTRKTKNNVNPRSMMLQANGETPDVEGNSNSVPPSQSTKSVASSAVSENSFWSASVKTDPSVLVMSRGCQSYNLMVGTSKQAKESQDTRKKSDPNVKPKRSNDVVSRNPDTSENTLSSYNSNMSLDHEPMVSN